MKIGATLYEPWRQANSEKLPAGWSPKIAGMNHDVGLVDANGNLARSMKEIQEALPLYQFEKEDPEKVFVHAIPTEGLSRGVQMNTPHITDELRRIDRPDPT